MAGRKDFSGVNTGRVYSRIDEATAAPEAQEVQKTRKTYTEEEQEQFKREGRTKGRKGCKMTRINMAFTPDVHSYITIMARVRGESITDFTNAVFAEHMKANAETYKRAQEFIKDME